ncbi:MAG TPA: class I SAM-dependent methyltransferase [Humisphaera sp.]|nr:class I SAM-dependent methyltransferase [Humisphaera sp.]
MLSSSEKANYGIDAPRLVAGFAVIGVVGVTGAVGSFIAAMMGHARWLSVGAGMSTWGVSFFVTAAVMSWGSKVGKLRLRDRILSSIDWRGNETVLDVGCGHGLMLITAAKRLQAGRVFGVDLWRAQDQSGNSREATLHNIRLEGVADKVTLVDGDARKLDFADRTFDVVLSSWAIHNIHNAAGREFAIREMARVLKPGGRLIVVDIQHTRRYADILRECGLLKVSRQGPHFLFVIPTFILTAIK